MTPIKLPTSYEDQVKKLRSRGCFIEDEYEAIQILSRVNYCRLTAYFLPFKNPDESYGTDIQLKHIGFPSNWEILLPR